MGRRWLDLRIAMGDQYRFWLHSTPACSRRPIRRGGNMAVDENCSSNRALELDQKRAKVGVMQNPPRPLPFSAFEWLLSGRYLRARRKEGFISVIAGFS